jgi:hypothetical protein
MVMLVSVADFSSTIGSASAGVAISASTTANDAAYFIKSPLSASLMA